MLAVLRAAHVIEECNVCVKGCDFIEFQLNVMLSNDFTCNGRVHCKMQCMNKILLNGNYFKQNMPQDLVMFFVLFSSAIIRSSKTFYIALTGSTAPSVLTSSSLTDRPVLSCMLFL